MLLARYGAYLAGERGLARRTIERNAELVRPFVDGLVRAGQLDLGGLTAAEVSAFMVQRCRGRPAQAQRTATALRSFLAFAHADGLAAAGLASAVPATASWKLAGLPRALTGEQVAALLGSCDGASVIGRRDSAVLAVLSRLGLRAGEVARLRLDDIDWRRGEIMVRGKGGRSHPLPLPADVGQMIVSYLAGGRLSTSYREVFICARAPYRPMSRGGAMLAAPDQGTWTGRRDYALLAAAIQTGLRASELTSLTISDVHLGTGAQISCTGRAAGSGRADLRSLRVAPPAQDGRPVLRAAAHSATTAG